MGQRFFISDFHFNDDLTQFDRTEFDSEESHTTHLLETIGKWADKLNKDKTNELWVLGDFGDINFLWAMDAFECKKVFVYGNHDKDADYETFKLYFDEVYKYPTFISNRILVSHFPQKVWDSQINIHGHLHGVKIDDPHYICCNVGDNDWKLFSERQLSGMFNNIDKFQMRFLWEPYAELPQVMLDRCLPRDDVIYNPVTKRLDISASRMEKSLRKN